MHRLWWVPPVHTPGSISVTQLVQVRRDILHALERVDHNVVDDVAPQHDVAPGGHPLPLVGRAKPPGLQDVFEVAVLAFYWPSALVSGEVLQYVGALPQLCQLLEAGEEGDGGHDADLWHLPPPATTPADDCVIDNLQTCFAQYDQNMSGKKKGPCMKKKKTFFTDCLEPRTIQRGCLHLAQVISPVAGCWQLTQSDVEDRDTFLQ